jgi:hypothetical protein
VNQLHLFAEMVREGTWVEAVIDHADADRKPVPKPDPLARGIWRMVDNQMRK